MEDKRTSKFSIWFYEETYEKFMQKIELKVLILLYENYEEKFCNKLCKKFFLKYEKVSQINLDDRTVVVYANNKWSVEKF